MALIKNYTYKGQTLTYHRIKKSENDFDKGITKITMGVYLNKAVRTLDKNNNQCVLTVSIPGVDLDRDSIYPLLKTSVILLPNEVNLYSGAQDDI